MNGKLELRGYYRIWNDDYAFFLGRAEGGRRSIARDFTFEDVNVGINPEPSFALDHDMAQQLVNQLWDAGIRPSQGKQSEGVTAAQGRHLEDMRAITFAKLNVEKPS